MKDGRFYLRLTEEERRMFNDIATEMGTNASTAVRLVMREKHREFFGKPQPKPPPKSRRKP
jgi:hypothetical protein